VAWNLAEFFPDWVSFEMIVMDGFVFPVFLTTYWYSWAYESGMTFGAEREDTSAEPEAVQLGGRFGAAIGAVERETYVRDVLLVEIRARIHRRQVRNDREHAHLLDQSPRL